MGLQIKMWLLVALMFGILYGVITAIGRYMGVGSANSYIILAILFMGFQYLIGPSMVSLMMRVKWVSEEEEPELHRQVAELAQRAGIPKPKVGVSKLSVANAFAFGRTVRDGRVCITQGIQRLLSKDELKAVIGHEISHLKHRDMMIITLGDSSDPLLDCLLTDVGRNVWWKKARGRLCCPDWRGGLFALLSNQPPGYVWFKD